MANPNIVNTTSIYGNSSQTSLTTTSATQIINNAASSGKIYKINSIIVANVDGTSAANITINIYSAASLGGTAYPIASTVSVPANSSFIALDRSTGVYLLENQSVGATAGSASDLVVTASWEEIS